MTTHLRYMMARGLRTFGGRVVTVALAATALMAVGGACHLLDVTTPDVVPAEDLNDPLALPIIRAGAIGDFGIAYTGSGASGSGGTVEGQVLISGLLADEWINTETFPDRVQADARQVDRASGTFNTVFRNLARAHLSATKAAAKFRELSDTTTNPGLTEMLSLVGFTRLFFAENYCSGVPISYPNPDASVQFGMPLTTQQMLDSALFRFNEALALARALVVTTASDTANRILMIGLASVGKARTLLAMGRIADADTVASAANVATGLAYVIQHDLNTARQQNGVFSGIRKFKRYGVADGKGGVGIQWRTVLDPRTPYTRFPLTPKPNFGFDGVTPQFDQLRYTDEKSAITLATGLEARLINAEAALGRGDTVAFMATLNALRAVPPAYILAGVQNTTVPGDQPRPVPPMAALATPTSGAAAVDLLFNERAHWLWGTGHRLNDLRRLVRAVGTRGGYGRAENTVFPNGNYFKNGLVYGTDVNYPIPLEETNNPNFTQCLDRLP
jgi:hypothetical protein